jgi:hypothetical protein
LWGNRKTYISKAKVRKAIIYKSYKEGYEFTFRKNKLLRIELSSPMKGETDKGIKLGNSTFKDLDSVYGYIPYSNYGDRIAKKYPGLIFLSGAEKYGSYSDTFKIQKIIISPDPGKSKEIKKPQ